MVYGGPHSALGRLRKTNLTSWPAKDMFDQKVKNDKTQCMGVLSSRRWYHSPCKETWKKFPTKLHEACDRCVWKKVCCIFESGKLFDSFARELLENYWRVLGCNTFFHVHHIEFIHSDVFWMSFWKVLGVNLTKFFKKQYNFKSKCRVPLQFALKLRSKLRSTLCSFKANYEAHFAVSIQNYKASLYFVLWWKLQRKLWFALKLQRVLRSLLRSFKANCKGCFAVCFVISKQTAKVIFFWIEIVRVFWKVLWNSCPILLQIPENSSLTSKSWKMKRSKCEQILHWWPKQCAKQGVLEEVIVFHLIINIE